MARKRRIHIPGGFYHVMLRGNGGQDVFFDHEERSRFCFLMQEGIERHGHRIHAFCLMDNHIHLAIQVTNTPLAKIMQNLSFRYTRWINHHQSKMGHLFVRRAMSKRRNFAAPVESVYLQKLVPLPVGWCLSLASIH